MAEFKVYTTEDKLTEKQALWIDSYFKTNDYTTASRLAGYTGSNDNLRAIGYQNSKRFKLLIENRRKEINAKIENQLIADLDEIYMYWSTSMRDKFKLDKDRLKASELLAKAKGAFVERVEVKNVDTDWFIDG